MPHRTATARERTVASFFFLLLTLHPLRAQTGAALVQSIRSAGPDLTACYRVRDITLAKEDLKLYLTEGIILFSKPVNGERISAAFSADVEGGDGEVLLLPPYSGERQSLAKFTQSPNLDQHFRGAILLSTDGSLQQLFERLSKGEEGKPMPELAPLLAEQFATGLSNITSGFELRAVQDLLTPAATRQGLFFGAVGGTRVGNFDVFYDAQAREQIAVGQLSGRASGSGYDIWTSFPARSSRTGAAKPPAQTLLTQHFRIDASLDATLHLTATVRTAAKVGANPVRVLPFLISRAMHVTAARVDGAPAELIARDSSGAGPIRAGENEDYLVILPAPLAPGSAHEIEFEEDGAVISSAGNDVYFVAARANWYPRSGTEFAIYDLTFKYPKRLTLVTPGDVTDDHVDGDSRITRRVTSSPIRVAGFNLGDYEKISGGSPGFRVDVYGNHRLENALQPRLPLMVQSTDPTPLSAGRGGGSGLGRGGRGAPPPDTTPQPLLTPSAPDPVARLRTVASDVASAVQYYSGLFGPPAAPSLTVAPIPGPFGQGFPGLVYLSTLAYLDPNARPSNTRGPREQVFFSDIMEAHEVAHQWWGDLVIPAGYQDEWLSEALASYSALMYLEKKKGPKALEDVLEDYRDTLLRKNDDGVTAESAGPITLGFRLESGSEEAFRDIVYYKGAWVFHMLRRRMGDERFLKMLAELRRRFDATPVSTADLRTVVKQFLPPGVTPSMIDSFFDTWVYSTGIPALKATYTAKGVAPAIRITGTVEQSGVADDFSTQVPVEIQLPKGPPQIVWVDTTNSGAVFNVTVKQPPVKISIPTGTGVLAAKK
ncbi:MAG TPA: M1 family aminopeptidase [Bryobacteraceae bacterium]|jgi:hypothetical protein